MQYALLYFESPTEYARRTGPDAEDYWAAWTQYMELMTNRGVMRGGNALQPADTRTLVRTGPGGRVIEDGPFADAREELGGFVIIEAKDLDEALELAEAAPCASSGHVEVRPVLVPQGKEAAA
ncbi:MAG: YciI family protein [Pseudomonadota bacterium]